MSNGFEDWTEEDVIKHNKKIRQLTDLGKVNLEDFMCKSKNNTAEHKKSKYGANKVEIDGIKFDSQKEADRYSYLKILERTGKIKNLVLQPKFELQEAFVKNDLKYKAIYYIADFMYFDIKKQKKIVEDVKSEATSTPVYKLKRKLFERKYNELTIVEIY